jgi:hypothetical protein
VKGNGPSGKKSGFGKSNKHARRVNDHLRPSRLRYNLTRRDLQNKKRKLRRHLQGNRKHDSIAQAAWDRAGFTA